MKLSRRPKIHVRMAELVSGRPKTRKKTENQTNQETEETKKEPRRKPRETKGWPEPAGAGQTGQTGQNVRCRKT